jgi:homoserine O-acetyltransferase/O-succinyltransferase
VGGTDIDWLIQPDGILDPTRWFIIIPNMFGNGRSTSPSNNSACGLTEQGFWFTHVDNVRAQEQLLTTVFGIDRLASYDR